jgi:8-amino-7-oxononanoate synthase
MPYYCEANPRFASTVPRNPIHDFATELLAEWERAGLLRVEDADARDRVRAHADGLGGTFFDASSNDYLGFASEDVSRETSKRWAGVSVGAGASRLIHGTRGAHLKLESALAEWVGHETALLFTSGYAANLGLVSALGQPGTVVVSDALNHASLIDGCRLSRARVVVARHLELAAVRDALAGSTADRARWVVTESYFSMDGDGPDLPALRALCDEFGAALIVDEAHALGVFGSEGAGRCVEANCRADAIVGTLGKSVGLQGAFVAGPRALRALLWNRARSFVFSTAMSPLLATLALFHVQQVRAAETRRALLRAHSFLVRGHLARARVPVVESSFGPIVGVLAGDEGRALALSESMAREGVLAQAIRSPTVPAGEARVRLTLSATWTTPQVDELCVRVIRAVRSVGL